jgi:hypothetical protein
MNANRLNLVSLCLAGLLIGAACPFTLSAQTNGQAQPETQCKLYFRPVWATGSDSKNFLFLMTEEQTKWWRKKGAKKYRGACDSPRPGNPPPLYVIVFRATTGNFTFNEPVLDWSGTTVSGDVHLQAETNSLHFEQRTGTHFVISAAVYVRDADRTGHLVYAVQRTSAGGGSGVLHPEKDTFDAALKWIAETEHLRK